MHVSVILPVYNAANYVTQAVESALQQPETTEVLLIEDGSPDNALDVCQQLAEKYGKVKLLRHPNGENRGAGASRNLGMRNANCEFIAFLDADDYFLPSRFSVAKKIFEDDPTCEGVYEAIGMHAENESALRRWQEAGRSEETLKTMKGAVKPDELGEALIEGGSGHFSLDGFTIKKDVLNKSGYMEEGLSLHQDTNFIIRVALVSKLLPGRLDMPVTMWRVHNQNRISTPRTKKQIHEDRMKFLMATYCWCKVNAKYIKNLLVRTMFVDVISISDVQQLRDQPLKRLRKRISQLIGWIVANPELAFETQLWKSLSILILSKGKDV